jgi:hypothetical protein
MPDAVARAAAVPRPVVAGAAANADSLHASTAKE